MDESTGPDREPPLGVSPTPASSRNLVFDVANWHPKPVKRPRPVKSCTECRRRKLRCDRRCPCSQCQRSYRVCKYGSGGNGPPGSGSRNSDPNNPHAESDGSEGSDDEDDAGGVGPVGERPPKRHYSRSIPGHAGPQQPVPPGGARNPPFNSSLSLLLNPPSPALPNSASPASTYALPPASFPASLAPAQHPAGNLQSPLLTLNGNELRQFTSALIDEFSTRMERLEKLVLARDASALSSMPSFPSSSTLSQLHLRQQPQHLHQRIIDASSTTMRCLTVKGPQGLRTRFFGQNSTRVLLNLFDEARDFVGDRVKRDGAGDLFARLERIYTALLDDHQHSLKPITVYVDSMMPIQKRMADVLPRREVCDRLLDAYVSTSEGLYRIIHMPTFRREYEAYWDCVAASHMGMGSGAPDGINGMRSGSSNNGSACADDFLPRLLCVISIGSRFETESKGFCYDRSDGVHIPTACALVRSWLDNLRGKQMAGVTTLQAYLLLLHANRMIAPRTINTWTELGVISRMAMCMGLHRDPSEFSSPISPFQAEYRRKLWFTILDMDLHVALACSLPNALRPNEFTCLPPRNLDDTDLFPEMSALPIDKPMDQYTDGQLQAYAAGTLPLRMRANDLLCHIDTLRDYGEVLAVGGELEKALDDINCLFPRNAALGTQKKYKEWRMRALLDMHVRRPLLGLYRPFALSASADYPPPAAISDVYLKSSMAMLTYMEELDPDIPSFDDISHMYYVILRHDIIQAAFSVCFYIKQAVESEAAKNRALSPSSTGSGMERGDASVLGSGASAVSPNIASANYTSASPSSATGPILGSLGASGVPGGPPPSNAPRPRSLIWSSAYMIRTVERTVDNLARLANDLSTDLRDVVALAIVLGSVQPANGPEDRNGHIRSQVGRVLDACIDTLRGHSSAAIRAAAVGSPHTTDWYNRPSLVPDTKPPFAEESAVWDLDFWDAWLIEHDQR